PGLNDSALPQCRRNSGSPAGSHQLPSKNFPEWNAEFPTAGTPGRTWDQAGSRCSTEIPLWLADLDRQAPAFLSREPQHSNNSPWRWMAEGSESGIANR